MYGMVGFRSRTSFYRSFKQITGLSPREFTKVKN
ncbi:MAG: AraC family transcriptional regulator [Prevotellaceae bacterium]|nr:AraC family transcriptional regulator [Prevotellaceae bacterium]